MITRFFKDFKRKVVPVIADHSAKDSAKDMTLLASFAKSENVFTQYCCLFYYKYLVSFVMQ